MTHILDKDWPLNSPVHICSCDVNADNVTFILYYTGNTMCMINMYMHAFDIVVAVVEVCQ